MDDFIVRSRFSFIRHFKNLGEHIFIRQSLDIHELFGHIDNILSKVSNPKKRLYLRIEPFTINVRAH